MRNKTNIGKVGLIAITPTPIVKSKTPKSIPVLRLRESATEARNGPKAPAAERKETALDKVFMSTPRLRLKTGRNGYTIRIAELNTIRAKTITVISVARLDFVGWRFMNDLLLACFY